MLAKAGKMTRAALASGEPIVFPSRSDGLVILFPTSVARVSRVLSWIMPTILSSAPRDLAAIMLPTDAKPKSSVPEAMRFTVSPEPKPRVICTSRPASFQNPLSMLT